jgi:hypothetical protein
MTDKNKTDDAAEVEGEPIVGHTGEELNKGMEDVADMGDYALDDAEKIALGIKPYPGTESDKT